jgi:hypothetical protein
MFLADVPFVLVFAGLLMLGIVGFLIMVVTMIFSAIGSAFRALIGRPERSAEGDERPRPVVAVGIVCERPGCGHVNPPRARFCARCGRRLVRAGELDEYG